VSVLIPSGVNSAFWWASSVIVPPGPATAAGRLGLDVVGRATWEPRRREYRRLARRVARAGAEAVFLGGLLDTNGARVVRDLRRELDAREADLLAPDGFTPVPLLVEQAGTAARGLYVTSGGLVAERLPPAGARFVERFAGTQPGAPVQASAVYAAQAAIVLLDAIARSDGTRSSVGSAARRAPSSTGWSRPPSRLVG
jgi:branched-chain amino acid transport system substrate-binding protein